MKLTVRQSFAGAAGLVLGLGVLAGCGSSTAPATSADMAAAAPAGSTGSAAKTAQPTDTQVLICGPEIRTTVMHVLQMKTFPPARSSYARGLYSCTYVLPMGPMRLSVQHSASATAARAYLKTRSQAQHATIAVPGLGQGAYMTTTGLVLTVKDDETLTVDTTSLPQVFGAEGQQRTDLAYEIASDVLGCWTGDD